MEISSWTSKTVWRRMAWMLSISFAAAFIGAVTYHGSAAPTPASAAQSDLSAAGVSAWMPQQVAASADYFLKLEGIDGESTDDKHKNEIKLLSWSFGASQTSSHGAGGGGGGGAAGKVNMQDLNVTMHVSKASPKLFLHCATGQHIKQATLTVRKAGGGQQEYLVVKLSDVQITSYQIGASSGDVVPTDQVSLSFAKIEFEYRPQRDDGSVEAPVRSQYDVKAGKGS